MNAFKVAISQALFLLVLWSITACAETETDGDDRLTKLVSNQVVMDFTVVKGELTNKKGNKNEAINDNAYLLSALELKKVSLSAYDYSVTLKHKKYASRAGEQKELLDVIHYVVSFIRLENKLENVFPIFKNNKVVETYLTPSKAPTKCYAFTAKERLHLVCHYGFSANDMTSEIISEIHMNETQL
jgi:hypothetical protein